VNLSRLQLLKFHDLESPIIIGKKDRRALMIDALIILLALISISPKAWAQSCVGNPAAVQILGSGGPRTNGDRASSSYLLWIGSQARVLVDMGGGAFLRFGQSQAKLSDLSLVAISHLHPDHVSDLPALLWLSDQVRKESLTIVGPSGNETAPSFSTFLSRLSMKRTAHFKCSAARSAGHNGRRREAFGSTQVSLT
jgi:ribonuclease BN (tRNA processing enzyme)